MEDPRIAQMSCVLDRHMLQHVNADVINDSVTLEICPVVHGVTKSRLDMKHLVEEAYGKNALAIKHIWAEALSDVDGSPIMMVFIVLNPSQR